MAYFRKKSISYIIDRRSDSAFNFKTSLDIFKAGYVKYELGVKLSYSPKPVKRKITLSGAWKIKRNLGLVFEIEHKNQKLHAIIFGAEAKLTARDTVFFRLRNELNKDMGVTLKLSHKILKGDGEAFLKLLKSKKECAVLAGSGWKW